MYGIWDRYRGVAAPSTLPTAGKGRSNLQSQTFTELVAGSGSFGLSNNTVQWYATDARGTRDQDVLKWGWVLDLPRNGEKIVYDPTLYGNGLFMSSVRTNDDPCAAGMGGTLYAIDPNGGGRTKYVVFDMDGNGVFNNSDYVGGDQPNGIETGAGKQTIRAGNIFDPGGGAKQVNHGLQFGRQNWRRQPPN